MAWKQSILDKVCRGLQQAAADGYFVPGKLIKSHSDDPGERPQGCGWGIIAWLVAVATYGSSWAKRSLPAGCSPADVKKVFSEAGLSEQDIRTLTMEAAWTHFDKQIMEVYENRFDDWSSFIEKSSHLADYFIGVLKRVPVEAVAEKEVATETEIQRQLPWLYTNPVLNDCVNTNSASKPKHIEVTA